MLAHLLMPILGADQKDLGLWKRGYTDVHPGSLDDFYTDSTLATLSKW